MTRLRALLLGHLLVFGLWGAWLVVSHRGSSAIWLETSPVDPRDFLSGHYVALRYEELERPTAPGCTFTSENSTVYLRLAPSKKTVRTEEGAREVWSVAECQSAEPPPPGPHVWIRGTRARSKRPLRFGIERYYVEEGSRLRDARTGQVVAKIAVNRAHKARLLKLVRLK